MVRMRADTVSLCKYLQAWRRKTDDSRYCCDQRKTMHGKGQHDLRAPGPRVPASERINQEDATRQM
jgi:hypothetical protein